MNKELDLDTQETEDPVKKVASKKELPKIKDKFYYDVKVECLLPATLVYRVLAESPHQAADMIKGMPPHSVQHKLVGRKELQLKVYNSGSSMMQFMKKLLGR